MPEILTGLKVDDFAHPDDIKATAAVSKIPGVSALMTFIEDKYDKTIFRVETMGYCVRLNEKIAPRPYKILRHVCQILDYPTIPEIYSYRSYSIDVIIAGAQHPIMKVSDFVLNNYEDSMLYFLFGRVVTRFKSGYMKYFTASELIMQGLAPVALVSEPLRIALANWLRKSELSADRGGLLACQNMQTAGRYFMNKAGMPAQFTKNVRIPDYLNACAIDNNLTKVGKGVQTLTRDTGWINDRLRELNNWYATGEMYDIIEKYSD